MYHIYSYVLKSNLQATALAVSCQAIAPDRTAGIYLFPVSWSPDTIVRESAGSWRPLLTVAT